MIPLILDATRFYGECTCDFCQQRSLSRASLMIVCTHVRYYQNTRVALLLNLGEVLELTFSAARIRNVHRRYVSSGGCVGDATMRDVTWRMHPHASVTCNFAFAPGDRRRNRQKASFRRQRRFTLPIDRFALNYKSGSRAKGSGKKRDQKYARSALTRKITWPTHAGISVARASSRGRKGEFLRFPAR